jgi:hypothetical protein
VVEADRTTSLNVTLKVAPVETTTMVVGDTPIVDATSQTLETRLRVDEFAKLAVARNYQALIGLAAGVVGTGNVNSHGALSSNNIFMFDGVNTTDPTTGTYGSNLNYEAIQEVVVRTATAGVEFGRGLAPLSTSSRGPAPTSSPDRSSTSRPMTRGTRRTRRPTRSRASPWRARSSIR